MGILGKVKQSMRDGWGVVRIRRFRGYEIEKFQDPRREAIYSKIIFTPE